MLKLLICIIVGALIYIIPTPEGIEPKAWGLLAIFASTILGIVLRPYPMGGVALIGLCVAILTGVLKIQTQALIGFSSPVIWLIVMIFFVSRGFIKTNLGTRIAYYFLSLLGKRPLTLGYGIVLTELFISPCIPSNTARAGGIMLPFIKSTCEALGSSPDDKTEKKVGAYLMTVGFQGNVITSAMFLTACAVNPIAQQFAADQNIAITWMNWFLAAIVPGMVSLLMLPLVVYWVYPPEQKNIEGATIFAQRKLKELGKMSKQEACMASIFLAMLTLWMFERYIGINATVVAFMGVALCLMTNILTVEDLLSEKEAWHTLIWLSVLVTMSLFLQQFGLIAWFAQHITRVVEGYQATHVLLILAVVYYYTHYFFAGNTSQVSAMYPAFLSVCLAAGAPPLLSALLLGFFGSLYSSTTHYGSAAGSIFFSNRYVTLAKWWQVGFIVSVVNLTIWLGLGSVWWRIIGLI